MLFALAFGIGVIAGLRALTAPAVVCWLAYLNVIHLQDTPLRFMGSAIAVGIFTLAAAGEIVSDKLPKTPPRTAAAGFGARIATGALTGGAVFVAGGGSIWLGALAGIVGAVVGTYSGYFARTRAVAALNCPDFMIALVEDAIAIGGGIFIVSRL